MSDKCWACLKYDRKNEGCNKDEVKCNFCESKACSRMVSPCHNCENMICAQCACVVDDIDSSFYCYDCLQKYKKNAMRYD